MPSKKLNMNGRDRQDGEAFSSDPIEQVHGLLAELRTRGLLAPICLSTVSEDESPNSRFVDLKDVRDGRFLFGTDGRSVKAREFGRNARVSFAAWWEPLQTQVRVTGTVAVSEAEISDRVFNQRSRSARSLAAVSSQSAELVDPEEFRRALLARVADKSEIVRPPSWNVYGIAPETIEILRFSEDRVHVRTRYVLKNGRWNATRLQP